MNKPTYETIFPISHIGWDEGCGDYGDIVFYNVTFNDNFGPIKKGDVFYSMFIEYCKGIISCYSSDNILIHQLKFKCIPV